MYKEYSFYKNNKPFSLFDIVAVIILFVLVALTIVYFSAPTGNQVYVYQHGTLIGRYDLNVDRELTINGAEGAVNIVTIKGGTVLISDANCNNRVCTIHAAVSQVNHQIVCAPHGLVVVIRGDNDIDAYSGGVQ